MPMRHDRRSTLLQGAALLGGLGLLGRAAQAQAAAAPAAGGPWPRAAFEAHTPAEALGLLGATAAPAGDAVAIKALDLVEDGANVEVGLSGRATGLRRLILLADRNPSSLAAVFDLTDAVEPAFTMRIKLHESSTLQLVGIDADGAAQTVRRPVRVTIGGCGDGAAGTPPALLEQPPQATRIRAQAGSGGAVVRMLMRHEMESGQRRDGDGVIVPAWHITEVRATLNGAPVFSAWWGPAVSKHPFLQFTLRRASAGDRVGIAWRDNRGASRQDEAAVA